MMQRRIEAAPIEAGVVGDTTPEPSYKVIEEHKPEPPREYWTDWQLVDIIEDKHPSYHYDYRNDGGLFRTPTIRYARPFKGRTHVWERKLVRRWVDEDGPKAMVVDTERRRDYL